MLALSLARPLHAESLPDMATALTAARAKNWAAAEKAAAQSGPLAQAFIQWYKLRAGEGSFTDYRNFADHHTDWPGMDLLYKKGEIKLTGTATHNDIIDWFTNHEPRTAAGAMALISALKSKDEDAAKTEAERVWISMPMNAAEEAAFWASNKQFVSDLNDARVFSLLDQQEWQAAQTSLSRMSTASRPLAEARIAVQSRQNGIDNLLLALPKSQQADPGLAMDRFFWRMKEKLPNLARQLMTEQSTSAENLRTPEAWAPLRADFARSSLRDGDWSAAEEIAASHFLDAGSEEYADLEFLAGYGAFRAGAFERALGHFQNLANNSTSVISQSRALYWQGRAEEAAGKTEAAHAFFKRAATMQSAYYGQLAAEQIGAPTDPALSIPGRAEAALPQWRRSDLRENEVFQAGVFAFAAGQPELGQRFFLHLSETSSPDDIARMARLTLEMHYPWYSLRLAKQAAAKGVIFPAAYFPLTGLEHENLDLPAELIMSISRQESEFNHTVSSHAGALGLMQLMPATAKQMADKVGLDYNRPRLTKDPYYNAELGTAYLKTLRDRFGPSSALVAVGYNAGPGRSRQWLERFGDIRTETDPVDWVEMIPFDETRNYVMRVTEALPIYRSRIAGYPVALTPKKDLTGNGIIPPPPKARQTLDETLIKSRNPPKKGDPISPEAAAFVEPEVTPPSPTLIIRPPPRPENQG